MTTGEDFDLIVIGGGPGGSTLASCARMRGHKVLLLERCRFPRYQIGESLLPATMAICKLVGALDEVMNAGFNPKQGGQWFWGSQPDWEFSFGEAEEPLVGQHWAYQVERMRFDDILLNNARRLGVDVREQSEVTALIEDGERVGGVRYTDEHGNHTSARARFVADAGGNTSPFYRKAGERLIAPRFRNMALFCYFNGGYRNPPPKSGSITVVTFEGGWFWYIPLSETLTSLGTVISVADAHKLKGGYEQAMTSFIESCPRIKQMLGTAKRVTEGVYGELRIRKDWSYCNTRFWKPGFILIGDAACFVDPLFSSGVHLATYAGLLGARSVSSTLDGTLPEERSFREFEERYRDEYFQFYRFLTEMYDLGRTKEEYFRRAHKLVSNIDLSDKQAFVRLVGGFGADVGVSSFLEREHAAMRDPQSVPEPTDDLPSPYHHGGRHLSPSRADLDIEGMMSSLQGGEALLVPSLSDNNLVPSADGLGWRELYGRA